MQPIYITNTASKNKELFTSLREHLVTMYHCGPTVYGYIHIGNLRSFLLADMTRRLMEWNNYSVTQVMNITDIGHLVSDGDTGEDKMTKGLRREGMEVNLENMLALAEKYRKAFVGDLHQLNILIPHHLPKASDHITEDIDLIQRLEKAGYCYETSDGLYFDTARMPDYGKLGGLITSTQSASRIAEHTEKKNSADFALWKKDDHHGWESPWGRGFPGWHIECSGMSMTYLGETIDIHTGGHDLASVHHNNEIAQSECATGKPFVRYWLHNEFVNINGDKMAKSGDNMITLKTLQERGYDPLAYRFLVLQTHYRSPLAFSWESLDAAQTALTRIKRAISELPKGGSIIETWITEFTTAINDDMNTSKALALAHQLLSSKESPQDIRATLLQMDEFLGLKLDTINDSEIILDDDVQALIDSRHDARRRKDWAESDRIRTELEEQGFIVNDNPDGTTTITR